MLRRTPCCGDNYRMHRLTETSSDTSRSRKQADRSLTVAARTPSRRVYRCGAYTVAVGLCAACLWLGCVAGGGSSGGGAPADEANTNQSTGPDTNGNGNGNDQLEVIGNATSGAEIYRDVVYACFVCHGDTAEGTALGPAIAETGALDLQNALAAGSQHTGGTQPDFTAQDYADLATFLEDTNLPPDVTTNGEDSGSNGVASRAEFAHTAPTIS